jgi:tetratricopeptide (TPR) repeat protein
VVPRSFRNGCAAAILALSAVAWAPSSVAFPLGKESPYHALILEGSEDVFAGRFTRALEVSQRIIDIDPDSPVGYFYRGAAYWWMFLIEPEDETIGEKVEENLALAVEKGERRLDADPDDVEAIFYLGGTYGFRARYRILRTEWWGAAWDGRRARQLLSRVAELRPDWVDTDLGLGMYNYYVDVLPTVFEVLRIVAFIPAGDRELGLRQLHRAMESGLYTRSEAQFFLFDILKDHEKDYGAAVDLVRDLGRRYPENPFFPLMEATVYVNHLGQWREAERTLREILAGLDDSGFLFAENVGVRARYYLGKDYFFEGDYERAQAAFEDLLSRRPTRPGWVIAWTHLRLGQVYDLRGRREDALREYRRVLEMENFGETHEAARRWTREPFGGW